MCDMANATNMLRGLLACRNHADTAAALVASDLLSLWSDSLVRFTILHPVPWNAFIAAFHKSVQPQPVSRREGRTQTDLQT